MKQQTLSVNSANSLILESWPLMKLLL